MSKFRIVIAAGGTGGHLYPTIAIADEIRRARPDADIAFIGTADRIEAQEVPRAGYAFDSIQIAAPGKRLGSLVQFPIAFLKAVMRSHSLLKANRPCAVLCGGAYLSVPVGVAAKLLGIPVVLLEINSVVGKANRLLSRVAEKIFLAYPESRTQFASLPDAMIAISGTPVRPGFGDQGISKAEARRTLGFDPLRSLILVFGGSLGARAINEAIAANADALIEQGYSILWQVGKGNSVDELKSRFAGRPEIRVEEYLYEMEQAYAAADFVICRAGASSLAELARLGKPAILVPYPHAAENHQEANARAFEQSGAAVVLRDNELSAKLLEQVTAIDLDAVKAHMSIAMKSRENKEAAKIVTEWLIARCKA